MCIAIALLIQLAAEPKVIAPGVISTPAEEFKATVSPDGLTLLYVLTDHQFRHMTIVESHRPSVAAEWQTPDVAAFSGVWRDGDPAFAPDGTRLLFISNRGVLYFSRGDHIYRVVPSGKEEMLPFEGGDPAVAADESAVVFDKDGDLFVSWRKAIHGSRPTVARCTSIAAARHPRRIVPNALGGRRMLKC